MLPLVICHDWLISSGFWGGYKRVSLPSRNDSNRGALIPALPLSSCVTLGSYLTSLWFIWMITIITLPKAVMRIHWDNRYKVLSQVLGKQRTLWKWWLSLVLLGQPVLAVFLTKATMGCRRFRGECARWDSFRSWSECVVLLNSPHRKGRWSSTPISQQISLAFQCLWLSLGSSPFAPSDFN